MVGKFYVKVDTLSPGVLSLQPRTRTVAVNINDCNLKTDSLTRFIIAHRKTSASRDKDEDNFAPF